MQPERENSHAMPLLLDGIQYVTAAEVARDVHVSRQTLWRWRQEGKVPVGRRFRDKQVLFTLDEARRVRAFANRLEPLPEAREEHDNE